MGKKTGNTWWDVFKKEQKSIERDMNKLDKKIDKVEKEIKSGQKTETKK